MVWSIANICRWHDSVYEAMFPGMTREECDIKMFEMLMKYNPEYEILWRSVYIAVRRVGWIPWYIHRLENALGMKGVSLFHDKWASVRGLLEEEIPTLAGMNFNTGVHHA